GSPDNLIMIHSKFSQKLMIASLMMSVKIVRVLFAGQMHLIHGFRGCARNDGNEFPAQARMKTKDDQSVYSMLAD
ncbi:MAG: hypothetical protein PHD82_13305, partial [Candidatus Riflebacteria bacterium]|nr:hypothetical protein [Candidatus Riflebacteria bacterium]